MAKGTFVLVDGNEGDGLQRNAAFPAIPHGAKHAPGNLRLFSEAVEMGADSADAVCISAAEGELHSRGNVLGSPEGCPVGACRCQSTEEGAVGIGRAANDMALVEMSVHVDEARPHDAARYIDAVRSRARGLDRADNPVLD